MKLRHLFEINFCPMTYAVRLLQGLWKGDSWSQHGTEVIILAAILVVSGVVAVEVFRWE